MNHEYYMQLAFDEALKGLSYTSPNPMVGAIIVKENRILARGYHHAYGEAHAEIEAIKNATESIEGATMYVTLEPCSHHGKTPPCALALIRANLRRIVISTIDPNPVVAGRGVKMLEDAGIEVMVGVLQAKGQELNQIFFHLIQTQRPYVLLKSAMSLDGKIATKTGQSQWISSSESREHAHTLRAKYRSILVGVNTVIADDPSLTIRLSTPHRQPIRLILDSSGKIPLDKKVLTDAHVQNTWIMTTSNMPVSIEEKITALGARVIRCEMRDQRVDFTSLMHHLAIEGIDSVLIEGGSDVAFSALESKVVDEVIFYLAPKILGGKEAIVSIGGQGVASLEDAFELEQLKVAMMGPDVMIRAIVKKGGQ